MRRPLALCLLLLAGCVPEQAPDPVVLLTGFSPFGGRSANVSWDAVAPLEGTRIAGALVHCVRLPVEWGKLSDPLRDALDRWHPCAVLCLGEGRPGRWSVELVATNRVMPYPDNLGLPPGRTMVIPGGPASYPTTLPVDAVVEALGRKGTYPVERSSDAGRYLCEECFFTLQHLARDRTGPHGFLHVPPYPEDAVGDPAYAAKVRAGVVAALEAVRKGGGP